MCLRKMKNVSCWGRWTSGAQFCQRTYIRALRALKIETQCQSTHNI